VKELEHAPLEIRRRLAVRMEKLSASSRHRGAEKLAGRNLYRVRQGDYRILYEVSDRDRTVTVFRIGHRREVYR
jgi:mRNA interferase RelE/StbE